MKSNHNTPQNPVAASEAVLASVQINPIARHQARHLLIQALYQWQVTGTPLEQIKQQLISFREASDVTPAHPVDWAYFDLALDKITANVQVLDTKVSPYLNRSFNELDLVEQAILRLASYELTFPTKIPHPVVLNEAIELAKRFGATASHRFINGVLDRLAKSLLNSADDIAEVVC